MIDPGERVYNAIHADLNVAPWADLPDFRRERFRNIAKRLGLMGAAYEQARNLAAMDGPIVPDVEGGTAIGQA